MSDTEVASVTCEKKLKAVTVCKTQSLRAAAPPLKVDCNCVCMWGDKETELIEMHPTAKRLSGAAPGNKLETTTVNDNQVEQSIKQMIEEQTKYLLVGFQGQEGAFSQVAAKTVFEELRAADVLTHGSFRTVGLAHTDDVMEAVEKGTVTFGVLPLENSISGTFHSILDRLVASHLKIVGEVACVQELCLCVLPGVALRDIEQLSSHPAVMDRCESFICAMERKIGKIVKRNAAWSSARACQDVKEGRNRHVATIASEQAAYAHGLVVLERGVEDELNSETRYMILGQLDASPLPLNVVPSSRNLSTRCPIAPKSSIVVAVPNEPQALFKVVSAFALRNVMIVKIESRPATTAGNLFTARTTHWDYIFYIDYITSQDPTQEARLRGNLEEFALWIRDLGTYSSSAGKTNAASPRWKRVIDVIAC